MMVAAQTPTPKFKNPPPGVCTADDVATEGQNKFRCEDGKWEWWATVPKPPARTVCTDGKMETIQGELYVCSFDRWVPTITASGGAPPKLDAPVFDTLTTVPLTVSKEPFKLCQDGEAVEIGEFKYICYNGLYDLEKPLDQFVVHSLPAGGTPPTLATVPATSPIIISGNFVAPPAMDMTAVAYLADTGYLTVDLSNGNLKSVTETRYKCEDTTRVLLTSEDGKKHCILFPTQQKEDK